MRNMEADQSQRPAEPTPKRTITDYVRHSGDPLEAVASADAKENKIRAEHELAMIEELRNNAAFRWFEEEFINKPYLASFDALRDEYTAEDDLPKIRATYSAFRKVKVAIFEREIAHRAQLLENDPEIPRLNRELRSL